MSYPVYWRIKSTRERIRFKIAVTKTMYLMVLSWLPLFLRLLVVLTSSLWFNYSTKMCDIN